LHSNLNLNVFFKVPHAFLIGASARARVRYTQIINIRSAARTTGNASQLTCRTILDSVPRACALTHAHVLLHPLADVWHTRAVQRRAGKEREP